MIPSILPNPSTRQQRGITSPLALKRSLLALWFLLLLLLVWGGCAGDSANQREDSVGVNPIGLSEQRAKPVRLEIRWRKNLVGSGVWDWAATEYSQPTVCCREEHVVVGTSTGELVVINISTGRIVWSYDTDGRIDARPAVDPLDDMTLVVGNGAGSLYAFDVGQGLRWKRQLTGELNGAPTISGGRVFILSSDEVLHAYDLATGERLWEYKRKIPDYITQQELSTPTVDNDRVYCGFADGSFVAIEAETGAPIWVRDLSGGETESTDVDAQPIIDEERIYITSFSGGVFALNRESGEVMWRAEMKGASTVVRSDDLIYTTTSRRHVVALNPNNGKRIWRIRHQRATPTIPMALDDYLLYGSTDGGLYVLDRNLGLPIVKFDPDVGFNAPLTVQDNRVFVFSNHGVLYAFEVKRAAPRNDFRLGRRDSPRP